MQLIQKQPFAHQHEQSVHQESSKAPKSTEAAPKEYLRIEKR
ncbi:hypothetical protein HSISS3_1866 [Streptococcus sp. HSISS3]|nr:hypothetical protein HSISS3_1866 [Streptococcus sp. HSISS3]